MSALSRKNANRKSLLRNLATSLILFEKIKTTTAKSKEVKPIVEHLISIAKANDLAARRMLLAYLFDENAVKKTFDELVPRYKNINSGFIRTFKLVPRLGDGAELTLMELVKVEEPKDKGLKDGKDSEKPEEPRAKRESSGKSNPTTNNQEK